jgi:uncharacterized protein (DUF433 family)
MSDPLALARSLRLLDVDALASLVTAREVSAAGLHDLFDLADALLDPASIRLALRSLPRDELERLAAGEAQAPDARSVPFAEALALQSTADPDGPGDTDSPLVFAAVRTTARQVLDEHPASTPPRDDDPAETADDASGASVDVDSLAGEHAFGALIAVTELGHRLRAAPLKLLARGGVPAADEKRLAPLLSVEPEAVQTVLAVARASGLVTVRGDSVWSTTTADDWGRLPAAERWLELASGWFDTVDAPTRRTLLAVTSARVGAPHWLSGTALAEAFRDLHPAADAPMIEALHAVDAVAGFLGLTAAGRSSALGSLVLARAAQPKGPADTAGVSAILPAEVTQVYVQHDLTIIAPGPLAPELDSRLRRAADLENRSVASGYRVTQQTIDRALAQGETPESLRAFLDGLSLTGIPQALDYLIAEGGRRHGVITVRAATADEGHAIPARTTVVTTDSAFADALSVDHSLAPLGFSRTAPTLLASRIDPDAVYWTLIDARYPALSVAPDGSERPLTRDRVAPAAPAAPFPESAGGSAAATATAPLPAPTPAALDLARRLLATTPAADDDSTAWIARRLDQAARARSTVSIDVRLPDGSTRGFEITPLSVANGRLRCLDIGAGVERTIPVSSIAAITSG